MNKQKDARHRKPKPQFPAEIYVRRTDVKDDYYFDAEEEVEYLLDDNDTEKTMAIYELKRVVTVKKTTTIAIAS